MPRIDNDVKLTQTFAILRYLGRKHGLAPITDAEKIRVDLIEAEINDMRANWSYLCYGGTLADFVSFFIATTLKGCAHFKTQFNFRKAEKSNI